MRIPELKIEEVRRASDIVDIISGYVKLKKRGKNFLGLCPFHTEKTPSFNVSPDRQMYHCFGCGVGGNAFTFIMEYEKVSFVESIRTLAERAGISLPQEGGGENKEKATESEALYSVCRSAARFFYDNMMNTVEGQLALEYFRHRGFTDETIRTFGLGYSMNGWDSLVRFAENEKLPVDQLEKAGLLIKRDETSGYYDRFRGRAMFPIFSVTGRVIGFGARKMREDDPVAGKYINSPETPIYVKSRNLYGLSQAKEALREQEFAILVEGYADLISVFQAGIKNVVASSGTALTVDQIDLISRYTKNITLVYDADSAGSKAAMRGLDLIIEQGLEVQVAALPEGEDPDSFVKKNGEEAFRKLLDEAVSLVDFKARAFHKEGSPEEQTKTVQDIVKTIAKMEEIKREFYIKHLWNKYGIYEPMLYAELKKIIGPETRQLKRIHDDLRIGIRSESTTSDVSSSSVEGQRTSLDLPAVERDLLKLMLEHGNEMVSYVFSHVTPAHFSHPAVLKVLDMIFSHADEAWDENTLINETDDAELRRFISDITFNKYELSKGWKEFDGVPDEADPSEVAERCMIILKRQEVEKLLSENQRHMKEAAALGKDVKNFVEHHQVLMREKKDLEVHGLTGERQAN